MPRRLCLAIGFILVLLHPISLKSQCYDDFFGVWKDLRGNYIELIEYNPKKGIKARFSVGNNQNNYRGVFFYENKILKIIHTDFSRNNQEHTIKQISFEFKVLAVDRQSMLIRAISPAMKSLFGKIDVRLFNENYVSFDEFRLDSIYCSQLNSPYDIQISYNGKMKLETDFIHKKKKYYKANIDQEQLNKLRELVLQSKIIYMSNCELRDQCSDCSPLDLKIFYNGLETRYEAGIIHDSVAPIIRFLSKLISESKWEKIRKKTAANKKN